MKLITGKVVKGRVEVADLDLVEGSSVVILALGAGEPIQLSDVEEAELREATDAIRRGEFVAAEDLLAELRSDAPA